MIKYTELIKENNEVIGGKNIFKSFLKCITALGLKGIKKSQKIPDGYLLYYLTDSISIVDIKSVLSRFKSINLFIKKIDYTQNEVKLFYGIKNDLTFTYGFHDTKVSPIGGFKLNKSSLNYIILQQSPSANAIKHDLVSLDMKKITTLSKINIDFSKFPIKYKSKYGPDIKDDIITFGYLGIGIWNNGVLDENDFIRIKNEFKNWLKLYKWSNNIVFNITYESFWVYFNLKLK